MKKVLLLICLSLPMFAFADTPKGEKLTKMLWGDIQAHLIGKIAHYTSRVFQGANPEAIITTRAQYLQVLSEFPPMADVQLLNMQTTQGENVITVTYLATITFVDTSTLPTSQMFIDVWKKLDDDWKLVSDAMVPSLISPSA